VAVVVVDVVELVVELVVDVDVDVVVVVQGVSQSLLIVQDVPHAYIVTNDELVVGISAKQ